MLTKQCQHYFKLTFVTCIIQRPLPGPIPRFPVSTINHALVKAQIMFFENVKINLSS